MDTVTAVITDMERRDQPRALLLRQLSKVPKSLAYTCGKDVLRLAVEQSFEIDVEQPVEGDTSGNDIHYEVTPCLPKGIHLDAASGRLHGTPQAEANGWVQRVVIVAVYGSSVQSTTRATTLMIDVSKMEPAAMQEALNCHPPEWWPTNSADPPFIASISFEAALQLQLSHIVSDTWEIDLSSTDSEFKEEAKPRTKPRAYKKNIRPWAQLWKSKGKDFDQEAVADECGDKMNAVLGAKWAKCTSKQHNGNFYLVVKSTTLAWGHCLLQQQDKLKLDGESYRFEDPLVRSHAQR